VITPAFVASMLIFVPITQFIFVLSMAYNRNNYLKHVASLIALYNSVKESDKPDTFIVKNIFPKHDIFISYSKWMKIKGLKPSEYQQPTLFD
jgi:hypothetical protein